MQKNQFEDGVRPEVEDFRGLALRPEVGLAELLRFLSGGLVDIILQDISGGLGVADDGGGEAEWTVPDTYFGVDGSSLAPPKGPVPGPIVGFIPAGTSKTSGGPSIGEDVKLFAVLTKVITTDTRKIATNPGPVISIDPAADVAEAETTRFVVEFGSPAVFTPGPDDVGAVELASTTVTGTGPLTFSAIVFNTGALLALSTLPTSHGGGHVEGGGDAIPIATSAVGGLLDAARNFLLIGSLQETIATAPITIAATGNNLAPATKKKATIGLGINGSLAVAVSKLGVVFAGTGTALASAHADHEHTFNRSFVAAIPVPSFPTAPEVDFGTALGTIDGVEVYWSPVSIGSYSHATSARVLLHSLTGPESVGLRMAVSGTKVLISPQPGGIGFIDAAQAAFIGAADPLVIDASKGGTVVVVATGAVASP